MDDEAIKQTVQHTGIKFPTKRVNLMKRMMSSEDGTDYSKIIKKQIAAKSNSNRGSRRQKQVDTFTVEVQDQSALRQSLVRQKPVRDTVGPLLRKQATMRPPPKTAISASPALQRRATFKAGPDGIPGGPAGLQRRGTIRIIDGKAVTSPPGRSSNQSSAKGSPIKRQPTARNNNLFLRSPTKREKQLKEGDQKNAKNSALMKSQQLGFTLSQLKTGVSRQLDTDDGSLEETKQKLRRLSQAGLEGIDNEQDIQKNWERIDKQKRQEALLLMQGSVRYKDGDEASVHRVEAEQPDQDGTFQFDAEIPPIQRYINFKATVIGRSLDQNETNKDKKDKGELQESVQVTSSHIKKQAMFAQKGKAFPSEGARRLDAAYREVEIMSKQLGLVLVQTRQKLQPFVDEGVIYKDRKIVNKKKEEEETKRKDAELKERIEAYRDKIQECIANKRLFELEQVLNELTLARDDIPDNLRIYKELRLSIIHGQICLASFFKWKREMRDKQVHLASDAFKQALIEDQKNEAKRALLRSLGNESPTQISKIQARKNRQAEMSQSSANGSPIKFSEKKDSARVPDIDLINIASTEAGTARSPNTASTHRAQIQSSSLSGSIEQHQLSKSPESQNEEQKDYDAYLNRKETSQSNVQNIEQEQIQRQLHFIKSIIDENIGVHNLRR